MTFLFWESKAHLPEEAHVKSKVVIKNPREKKIDVKRKQKVKFSFFFLLKKRHCIKKVALLF